MKTKKWKKWEDQGELKEAIRSEIDTGCCRSIIVDRISTFNPDKWTRKEIHRAITELKKDFLIMHCGHDYYKVTEWSHDAICSGALGTKNYEKALRRLYEVGVYHPDIEKYGLITKENV